MTSTTGRSDWMMDAVSLDANATETDAVKNSISINENENIFWGIDIFLEVFFAFIFLSPLS